jgi:hypothetical protein
VVESKKLGSTENIPLAPFKGGIKEGKSGGFRYFFAEKCKKMV